MSQFSQNKLPSSHIGCIEFMLATAKGGSARKTGFSQGWAEIGRQGPRYLFLTLAALMVPA
jgi:hypothetical protein